MFTLDHKGHFNPPSLSLSVSSQNKTNNRFLLPANSNRFHFQPTLLSSTFPWVIAILFAVPLKLLFNTFAIQFNMTGCRHQHHHSNTSYQSNLHCLANSNTEPFQVCVYCLLLHYSLTHSVTHCPPFIPLSKSVCVVTCSRNVPLERLQFITFSDSTSIPIKWAA